MPSGSFVLAADLGGTRIKLGVVDARGVRAHVTINAAARAGLTPQLDVIREALNALCARVGLNPRDAVGIGLGLPCLVDAEQGRVLSAIDKYPDAADVKLQPWVAKSWGIPLRLENDVCFAALGEHRFGAARGVDNAVIMTIGTGIGTAAIIGGDLLRGVHGQAGCLGGHMTVVVNGAECVCGNRGCLETEAASWALPRLVRRQPGYAKSALSDADTVSFPDVFDTAARGDTVARAVLDHCLACWSAGVVNLVHAYDPEIIVLGGGVLARQDIIVPHLQAYVARHAWTPWGTPRVVAAAEPNEAALLGVAAELLKGAEQ
jgi:glucokinase